MKTLMILLDGLPDKHNSKNPKTPLEVAKHPHLDALVKCGQLGTVDYGVKKPDTDECTLHALGYTEDPGRGFIDALGADVPVNNNWVYLRCNFATVNDDGRIVDRRAGRDPTGLDKLCKRLDGIEINDVVFRLYRVPNDSHRVVIALEGKGLSDKIKPNDSKGKDNVYKQIGHKEDSGRKTSSVLNAFLRKSREILVEHPANKERKIPANAILVRDVGKPIKLRSFEQRYKLKSKCLAFVLTVKGVARVLGMDVETPKGATGDYHTDLNSKMSSAMNALERYDFVLLHIDGADIASHDNKFDEKVRFIERLDKEVFARLLNEFDLRENRLIVTSDHITETGNYHVAGPVPYLVVGKNVKFNEMTTYTEKEASKGISLKRTLFDKI